MTPDNNRLNLLLDLRRYADAEAAAREAIAKDPDWAPGYTHLARALLARNKKKREAIKAAREGVRKAPQCSWAYSILACALYRCHRHAEARDAIEQSLKLNPHDPWAYAMLADILSGQRLHAQARAKAIEGLKIDPFYEGLFVSKAWAEHACGRYSDAIKTAEEGLKYHPNSPALRFVVAFIRSRRAQWVSGLFGLRRLRAHRKVDALARECVRLDPLQRIYRDCLRANAVSCRAHLVGNALRWMAIAPAVLLVFTLPVIGLVVRPPPQPAAVWLILATIVSLAVFFLFLLHQPTERCLLAAPLDFLRVPVIPLTGKERWEGRLELYFYGLLVLMPNLLILAALLLI